MKVCNCRKFGDLILKTVILVRFLKTKKFSKILKGNVWEFSWDRGRKGIDTYPKQNSDTFTVKFSGFKIFFGIKFHQLSISGLNRVLTLGNRLTQEVWVYIKICSFFRERENKRTLHSALALAKVNNMY